MIRSVYSKALYDKRWFMIGWTIAFGVLAALLTSFYPAMHQTGALDNLVASMPKAFSGLIGNLLYLKDFPSYIASQLFDIRMPLIAGIMSIILGLGLSTAEEESGELRTLLALPISRTKVFLQKWLAMITITFVATLGTAIGIYATLPFIGSAASLSSEASLRLLMMTWLLMITYGSITFSAGMIFGKRSIATGIGIVVIIGSFVLSTFGQAVEWLGRFEKLSLLHYFPAIDAARGTLALHNVVVLAAICSVVVLAGYIEFRRRDIG